VGLKTEMVPIFEKVVATRDRYGLHAYLTALENAGMRGKLEAEIHGSIWISEEAMKGLKIVLETATLPAEKPSTDASLPIVTAEPR